MFRFLCALLAFFSLLAQATTPAATATIGNLSVIYSIDASTRGTEIINLFSSLYGQSIPSGRVYEIALQTKYNGLITWVTSITGTTNNTLLLVRWGTTPTNSSSTPPLVIPVDQIVELIYTVNSQTISNWGLTNPYGASNVTSTLPLYSLTPAQRAADILSVYNYYVANLKNTSYAKYMQVYTTLAGVSGPNYQAPKTFNGLLPYVQSLSVTPTSSGSFLQVSYMNNNLPPTWTITVPAEWVSTIVFTSN